MNGRITYTPRAVTRTIDQLDADERDDDATEAVDEQVAAQHRRCRLGPELARPRSASGISTTMIKALKMTAERIAERGVSQAHHVELVERGQRRRRTSPG